MKQGCALIHGSLNELRTAAQLPTLITVTLMAGQTDTLLHAVAPAIRHRRVNGEQIEFSCTEANKLTLLRCITQRRDCIKDVQMTAPRLDDLYTHFVNGSVD